MNDPIYQLNRMSLPHGAIWMEFDPIDLLLIEWDGQDADHERVKDNARAGHAASLWINRQCLCSVGLADRRGGVGEAWAVIDNNLKSKYPILLTRGAKHAIDIGVKYMGLRDVQMYLQFSRTDAMKWAKALGFNPEGELIFHKHPEQNHAIFCRSF